MSIVEVAKVAGLSHSTVSRVINGRPGVSPETVAAVRRAMKSTGYTPPAKRRGPRPADRLSITTGNVGLLMFGTDSMLAKAPVTAAVFHAAEQALAEKGFNLLIAQIDEDGRLPPSIAKGEYDGLLLHGYAPPSAVRAKLENRPSVWMLSQRSMRGYWGDRVCPDNEIIGRLAADHLSARGHKRIAYLYFNATHMGFRGRAEAFCETAEEYGVQVDLIPNHPQSVRPGSREEHGPEATEQLVDELLALEPRPTAVFVPRDRLTVKVYRALRRRGIEPGRDIEIVSCDNEPILEALDPRPATIDVRPELIGRRAVDQLAFKMSKPADSTRSLVTVEPVLIGPDESEIVSQRQGTPAAEDTSPLASRSTRNGSPNGGEQTTTTGLNGAS